MQFLKIASGVFREIFTIYRDYDETNHTAAVWLAWKLATRRPCA